MAKELRKKIGLLFSTGTVISTRGNKHISFVQQPDDMRRWLEEIPELSLLAEVEPYFISGESEVFTHQSIENIANALRIHRNECEGFVVLVRAEWMIVTAVLLEFYLQGFDRPIVLTGSRHSPEGVAYLNIASIIKRGGLGLRSNIVNAIQVAASDDFPAVAIMFGNKIIKPTKARQGDFFSMNLFHSVDDDYLGKVDFGITLYRKKISSVNVAFDASREITLPSQLIIVRWSDITLTGMDKLPLLSAHAVVLLMLPANAVPPGDFIERIHQEGRTVVVYYPEHAAPLVSDVANISSVTPETAVAKVLWIVSQATNPDDIRRLLQRDYIGESLVHV